MNQLLADLKKHFPNLNFTAGEQFYWSPKTDKIFYAIDGENDERDSWSLLHETGHALLGHTTFKTDFELLKLEVEAWQKAQELAPDFGLKIDPNHIEDCLDSYRDWLHKRSLCPTCNTVSLQEDSGTKYRCHNCHTTWTVTKNRFCRAYRSTSNTK